MNHRHPGRVLAVLPLLLSGCNGGPEVNLQQLNPDIAVTTLSGVEDTVVFGEVTVLYTDELPISVVNAGRASLDILDIRIADNDDGVFEATWGVEALAVDEDTIVNVRFTPATYAVYERQLTIETNDPDTPAYTVTLTGEGVDGAIPDISVDRASVDFGAVAAGDSKVEWFTITNAGDGDLDIDSIEQTGSGAFSPQTPLTGQTLAPGSSYQVILAYDPDVETGDSGTLTIHSNDPDEGSVEVLLVGNGGSEDEYPQAVIECDPVVRPLTTHDLDGRGSYDPQGQGLVSYQWMLYGQPDGSTAALVNDNTDFATIFIDTAGPWEVGLQVTNSVGLTSAPARCAFDSIPEDKIHVELAWNTGDTDLDLHLVQEGFPFFDSQGDCSWCNKNPNWGTAGGADDPLLALDNIVGYGPEDLTIDEPADGDYHVKVHYFKDLLGSGAVTTATVKVFLNGELAGEYSRNLSHNEVWDVGYIRWPQAVFAAVDVAPYAAPRRNCTSD
ncbi:MAG: choice-of-anchor D domain-containing protein [Myxococcota bacterium]|nr:choice-of-anchor D domain-containing protein [Myxococcota bacterium]MEC8424798.1 choice-of-anchor D domain-containing protein [Myxococcota bacterium]